MTGRCYQHRQTRDDVESTGIGHDLCFHSRRGREQIDLCAVWIEQSRA